jgi:hypothetical protein
MTQYGRQGWRLVAVDGSVAVNGTGLYFERQLPAH